MTTYGDMVTLLLCFFIMLFAFSNLNVERFRAIMSSLQGALGVLDAGVTIMSADAVAGADSPRAELMVLNPREIDDTQDLLDRLEVFRRESGLQEAFSLEMSERGVVIHFTDRVLFDVGRADLRADAMPILVALAETLRDWPNPIRVEGHTDNVPIQNNLYPSNWELSTARASRVVRYLVERGGLSPDRLSAAGYGEYRPVASNDTAEGRARNRRVDVVLLSSSLAGSEPVAVFGP